MGRMHWIVATLALGSLVLGSLALGSLAVGGSALARVGAGGEIGIGFTFAPGQQETSPGKVFHDARASDPAPGKLYLQNKSNAPTVPQAPYRALGTSSGATGAKLSAPRASVSRVDFEAGGLSNSVITSTRVGSASAFSRI